jgi:hypothetical protein
MGRKPLFDEPLTAAQRQRRRRARLREEQERLARAARRAVGGHPVDRAVRVRLAKLCGLLSSDHDGERAAAAAKITADMKRLKLTWYDLLSLS